MIFSGSSGEALYFLWQSLATVLPQCRFKAGGWGLGGPPFSSILLLVQLEDSQERLCRQLHRAQAPHLLPARPAKSPTSRGPLSDFTCSGQMNCPCAKVFASGENACTALPRRPAPRGPEGKAKMLPPLLLVQLEDSQERLCRQLHRAQAPHLLPARPAKSPTSRGPLSDFTCSGQMNCPCAKVFASGENACTALPRRPAPRGPEGKTKMLPPPPTRPA